MRKRMTKERLEELDPKNNPLSGLALFSDAPELVAEIRVCWAERDRAIEISHISMDEVEALRAKLESAMKYPVTENTCPRCGIGEMEIKDIPKETKE
jgi:hypothetical protein